MNKKELPDSLIRLYEFYSGEAAWQKFANYYSTSESKIKEYDRLRTKIPANMVRVMIHKFGDVDDWLDAHIPVLDNYKPRDILENYHNGDIVIKEILMRIPY